MIVMETTVCQAFRICPALSTGFTDSLLGLTVPELEGKKLKHGDMEGVGRVGRQEITFPGLRARDRADTVETGPVLSEVRSVHFPGVLLRFLFRVGLGKTTFY